jgi:hypothetical protein
MITNIFNGVELAVTHLGDVFSNGAKMKQYSDKDGYALVNKSVRGKTINFKVHRLVAEIYIPNPENKRCVNHIDGNKTNNKVENLEWVTHSENMYHAFKMGLTKSPMKGVIGADNHLSKPVGQYSLDGELLAVYPSAKDAHDMTGVCRQDICKVRSKSKKSAGGYIWK